MKTLKYLAMGMTVIALNAFGQSVITNQGLVLVTNSTASAVSPSQILPAPAPTSTPTFVRIQQQPVKQQASGMVALQQIHTTQSVVPNSRSSVRH